MRVIEPGLLAYLKQFGIAIFILVELVVVLPVHHCFLRHRVVLVFDDVLELGSAIHVNVVVSCDLPNISVHAGLLGHWHADSIEFLPSEDLALRVHLRGSWRCALLAVCHDC